MSRAHLLRFQGLWIVTLTIAALSSSLSIAPCDPTPVTITLRNGLSGYSGCSETTLSAEYQDMNYGNADEVFWVQKYASGSHDYTAMIKFDLTGQLPSGTCIKSARLRLYQWNTYNMSSDYLKVAAYRCLQEWDEGTGGDEGASYAGACWPYRKCNPYYGWNAYGARGSDTDRHATYDDVQTCTEGARWVEWDVTPSVQRWVRSPSENHGLVLDWTEVGISTAGVNFRTSEWGSEKPELVITYVVPTAEPVVTLDTTMSLNYFDSDPSITATGYGTARMTIGGTTSVAGWGADGTLTNVTYNDSCECSIKVKLEDGVVSHGDGTFSFRIWLSDLNYVQLAAIWGGYYEMSGQCPAVGNGERHDGSAYWSSNWDDGNNGIRLFSSTPENEETEYLTWKLRYDKTNQMLYAYVNDVMVTYYSNINFSNFRGSLSHKNDLNSVATMIRVQLFNEFTPPTPNPLTWSTQPYAVNTASIGMVSSTATDADSPPVEYQFVETTGHPGGSTSAWQGSTSYTDSSLNENTQYGYKVQARDSMAPPNAGGYSGTVSKYTLIAAPTGITTGSATPSTIDLVASGTLPNLNLGSSGVYFTGVGVGGLGEWLQSNGDQATGLSANTQYQFRAKARNGDGIETAYCAIVPLYAGMPTPVSVTAGNVTANTADLTATGSFPNLTAGSSGIYFDCPGASGIHEWIQVKTDQATTLTPNAEYTFRVKARNGDAVETGFAPTSATVRTLAAVPSVAGYNPFGCTTVQANWGANGNPPETEYFCREETTGRESGWGTGTSWILRFLQPNGTYHFYVKARNADGIETAETDLGEVTTGITIGYVKLNYHLGDHLILRNKTVSGVLPGARMFFLQDARVAGWIEGPAGLAVIPNELLPMPVQGQAVDVSGTLKLNPTSPFDQELVFEADMVVPRGLIEIVEPYAPNNRDAGGEDFGLQAGVWNNVMSEEPLPAFGTNNIGRLVRTFGAVHDGGLGGVGYIWIDDGQNLLDNDSECYGIRVDLSEAGGFLPLPLPDFCVVTGEMRCIMVPSAGGGTRNVRLLVPRKPTDIVQYHFAPSE